MTRVECLYRVSTKGQVDHDDIPMQRIECRKFAEQQGWNIIKELCEKGVSGFKISADDRDAIQELREDAMNQRFDVLLVFMFDRLGRRDDETPFVVEWFAKQGIRIFSVKEGEQKFESHTDSLINYIRYWQSEGESRKTSMRIKTRLDQMRGEGLYTGGITVLQADCFNPRDILECGQIFRFDRDGEGNYRVFSLDRYAEIKKTNRLRTWKFVPKKPPW